MKICEHCYGARKGKTPASNEKVSSLVVIKRPVEGELS